MTGVHKATSERSPIEVVALGAVALAILEIVMRSAAFFNWALLRNWFVAKPWTGLFFVGLLIGISAAGFRWKGALVGALTVAALIITILRFRGLWIWPGTFDYYFSSTGAWIWAMPIGLTVGFGAAMLKARKPAPVRIARFALILLFVSGITTLILSQSWAHSVDSMYPPTRAYLYLSLFLPMLYLHITEGNDEA